MTDTPKNELGRLIDVLTLMFISAIIGFMLTMAIVTFTNRDNCSVFVDLLMKQSHYPQWSCSGNTCTITP